MKLPKQCPICGFMNFKETPKKITCELCGWSICKNPNRRKVANKGRFGSPKQLVSNPPPCKDTSRTSKYFTRKKPRRKI